MMHAPLRPRGTEKRNVLFNNFTSDNANQNTAAPLINTPTLVRSHSIAPVGTRNRVHLTDVGCLFGANYDATLGAVSVLVEVSINGGPRFLIGGFQYPQSSIANECVSPARSATWAGHYWGDVNQNVAIDFYLTWTRPAGSSGTVTSVCIDDSFGRGDRRQVVRRIA